MHSVSEFKLSVNPICAFLSSISGTMTRHLDTVTGDTGEQPAEQWPSPGWRADEERAEREKLLTTQRGTTKCVTDASSGICSWHPIVQNEVAWTGRYSMSSCGRELTQVNFHPVRAIGVYNVLVFFD